VIQVIESTSFLGSRPQARKVWQGRAPGMPKRGEEKSRGEVEAGSNAGVALAL
jgi:hypothetical protein